MRLSHAYFSLLILIANLTILFVSPDWFWLRFPAALLLTFVLPGWAWSSALAWMGTSDIIERLILVPGLSSILSALALLIALLLPGPFTETPNLIALDLVALTGLLFGIIINKRQSNPSPFQPSSAWRTFLQPLTRLANLAWRTSLRSQLSNPPTSLRSQPSNLPTFQPPTPIPLLILLVIVAVAVTTRLTRLGYAEFHEDELENMRLIVRAYKGEEYAPFLDSKGPIHWLLPAALWYLNGWVNEDVARTPFVLTSLLLIPLMYSLGRRMSGDRPAIGLLAAGFVAVNGFYVAYARHVENQSLIVFWGALAMWFAYRSYQENIKPFLGWVALILGIGLVAHPDVLLYLPVFAYLLWLTTRRNGLTWPWLIGAGTIFVGLLALFYLPYFFDPEIGLVYQYFTGDRIGEGLFYNRVGNLFDQDQLYSTRYHAPVWVLLLFWLLARQFAQWGRRGWLLLSGLSLTIVSTVIWPGLWIVGGANLAFAPYALLTLLLLLLPHTKNETKIFFLWFSAPLGALIFLAKDAADHVQIAYTGLALLSALALADLWTCLSAREAGIRSAQAVNLPAPSLRLPTSSTVYRLPSTRFVYRLLKILLVVALVLVASFILFYQFLAFDVPVTTYWQAKIDSANRPNSIYNLLYGSLPRPRKIFSNPRLGGWKAVGYLWSQGTLSGDFRSINESFAAPVWYTFQTPRSCYEDPQNYWVRNDWNGWPEEEQALPAQGYTLTRIVLVDQQPMLHLYEKKTTAVEPQLLDMEAYRSYFDRLMTPARLAQDEPIEHPASANFGDKLLLRGYNLPQRIAYPGDLLPVTLYWESLAPMEFRYRGFIHLVGADSARWGQHDDDPACRLLTTEMRPGQRSSRQFRLSIDPATPPGEYQIILGLYNPDTQERLPIWDNLTGRSPGDSLVLGQVRVE